MFIDFLGNEVNVGDMVIYTPANRSNDLVLAEVLAFREAVRYGWRSKQDGSYGTERYEIPYFKVDLQPVKSNDTTRGRTYKDGKYIDGPMRKVTLPDNRGIMFYSKKVDND